MGNPNCCIFVDDFDSLDWRDVGRRIENHQQFPDRTNVVFVRVDDPKTISLRIWERGVGETEASGTCSCAAAVAAMIKGKTERLVTVLMPGGQARIQWRGEGMAGEVVITGSAEVIYGGEWFSVEPARLTSQLVTKAYRLSESLKVSLPPMNSPPDDCPRAIHELSTWSVLLLAVSQSSAFSACGGNLVKETVAESKAKPAATPVSSVPNWLGNRERNFYGTGPWQNGPLEIVWEFETGFISGRLHKDPWGGSSWPGQPSIAGDRVYFPSADGNIYCVNRHDGSLIWKFKAKDSFKATPTIAGDRIIASGLDHNIYCLNAIDGSLLWEYETGFEVDCSASVVDGRVYFGGEDGFFYCLNLADGSLVYKTERLGSMEGSFSTVDGRIYIGTEQGDLFCLNLSDGSTIWKARIGADSDSTPAVAGGFVYTAAEDGYVYCFRQSNGELVWKFKAEGGFSKNYKERSGFWASPIVVKDRIYIGSNNGFMYCLSADKGEVVWQHLVRAPIWGTFTGHRWARGFWRQGRLDLHAVSQRRRANCGT